MGADDLGTDDEIGPDVDRHERSAESQPREDTVFPEDFRKLMRRIFGAWNRNR